MRSLLARIDGGDDGADGLLIEALESALALEVLQVAADRAFVRELVELGLVDELVVKQALRALAPHGPALALGEGLFKKLEIAEGLHGVDAECHKLVAAQRMAAVAPADGNGPNMFGFADPTGIVRTYNVSGSIDFNNPFFQSLGTNGRSCGSCHQPANGWTIVPSHVQARFEATDGEDPLFRTNDGSNSPNADVSTVEARRSAYSMLLTKGLIRVRIVIPLNAEFELIDGYAFMPRPQWPDSHNSLSRDRGAICPARPCHTYY